MARSTRETERTYAVPDADISWLPALAGASRIASVADQGVQELDAVYYDSSDLRLTRSHASLRRRTGGTDAGWHLKLPLPGDSREEIQAPLGAKDAPEELRDLTLSRTRGAALRPVMRIRSSHSLHHLLDAEGDVLAKLSMDEVSAEALLDDKGRTAWTEMEVELVHSDPALLDSVEKAVRKRGLHQAQSPSKVLRALTETTSILQHATEARADLEPGTAGSYVLAYIARLVDALTDLDPAVRRDVPDSVHQMRTTARRLRGCLRSYRPVLDREATDPIRRDLKWLAGELGQERDHEVLRERLTSGLRELPGELVLGPAEARLKVWDVARQTEARRRTLEALASPRYLNLLQDLKSLTEVPPLHAAKAVGKPGKVLGKALRKEYRRLARRMEPALAMVPGPERDTAIHHARKAAKRLRYASEAARPALGRPARRLGKRVKAVQRVSGAQHDSVVTRDALRQLAVSAHAAGEPGFTWGILHGREAAAAGARERQLPQAWAKARAAARKKAPWS
ncbi:CYTH and CHAD domain-containing protein [Streptomyces sp. NPDC005281]|uniref:CYTH and CHAD domain-containing protein n=1 Tax=Streptomyces sp. NPDC005281 TaxID=3155712 RepID=UPI00339EC043